MLVKVVDGTPVERLALRSPKTVLLRCDNCGKENTTTYSNYTKAQERNQSAGKTYCRTCALNRSEAMKNRPVYYGKDAPRWKGGRKVGKDGLVAVYKPSPTRKSPYIHSYVAIMEDHLGRELLPNENVHHIDGNRSNDDLSNLVVLDASKHHKAHIELERIGYQLIRVGLIVFDREAGTYKVSEELAAEI